MPAWFLPAGHVGVNFDVGVGVIFGGGGGGGGGGAGGGGDGGGAGGGDGGDGGVRPWPGLGHRSRLSDGVGGGGASFGAAV